MMSISLNDFASFISNYCQSVHFTVPEKENQDLDGGGGGAIRPFIRTIEGSDILFSKLSW